MTQQNQAYPSSCHAAVYDRIDELIKVTSAMGAKVEMSHQNHQKLEKTVESIATNIQSVRDDVILIKEKTAKSEMNWSRVIEILITIIVSVLLAKVGIPPL